MRPHNDEEREVVRLHGLLPAPTMEQLNWIFGQSYEYLSEDFANTHKKVERYDYFCIVTALQGWQVTRYYLISTKMTRNGYTFNYLYEVSQRWMQIDEQGNMSLHIFERPKHMNWYWHAQPYSLNAPLSLKTWNTNTNNRGGRTEFCMADFEIVPGREFAQSFVDAGLDKAVGRVDEIWLYRDRTEADRIKSLELSQEGVKALTRPCYLPVICETLFKMGEPELANEIITRSDHACLISKYWGSFLVARRHGLRNVDWHLWLDYVRDLDILGRDIRSPKYLCPEDIGVAHARVLDKITDIEQKREWENVRQNIADYEPRYAKAKGMYFGITFTTMSGLVITTAKSVRDIYEEGLHMHHCVYKMGYYKNSGDLIMFARTQDGRRVETIRINLNTLTVAESRGLQNKATEWHDEIVDALKTNMWMVSDAMKQDGKRRTA